ncbi:MAG: hypothetical protein J0L61_13705, partial [Planctomycetes bacterium]|nr:hypothetical protein [Planctomycetota bacterium]
QPSNAHSPTQSQRFRFAFRVLQRPDSRLRNWTRYKRDLNADGDWADSDEMDDSRTHNAANELTGRDTDTSGVDNYALMYDAV